MSDPITTVTRAIALHVAAHDSDVFEGELAAAFNEIENLPHGEVWGVDYTPLVMSDLVVYTAVAFGYYEGEPAP